MQIGSEIKVKLENLAYGGECVGHLDNGMTVFVAGGVPGDIIRGKVYKRKRNLIKARIIEIISPANSRIEPECEVYEECGGCQLQQINYKTQINQKKNIVKESLKRIGKLTEVKVNKVIGDDFPWYYRNKAQFPFTLDKEERIETGFFRKGTHEIVVNQTCLIQHQLINRIKNETIKILNKYELTVYNEKKHQGLLRHLLIRAGICTNQALVVFVTRNEFFPNKKEIAQKLMDRIPELKGVLQNINTAKTNVILGEKTSLIKGRKKYTEYVGFIKYEISTGSFFQINTLQTKKLYDTIKSLANLTGKEIVLDTYCGIGSIGLYLAEEAREIVGIEIDDNSIKDAKNNACINNIENCNFIQGKVENKIPELIENGLEPEVLVVDPPRKGLEKDFISNILSFLPEKIIYVSCNPSTLSRDLKQLKAKYEIIEVQPVDMFPQTYHIETVTGLSRK